jgi:hypothetical protein
MLPRLCNNPLFKNIIFNRGIFHGKRGCFPGVCAAGAGASHAVWQLPVHDGHWNWHVPDILGGERYPKGLCDTRLGGAGMIIEKQKWEELNELFKK